MRRATANSALKRDRTMTDLQNLSDKELHSVARSKNDARKSAIAKEILRRRRDEKWQKWAQRNSLLAGMLTAAALAGVFVTRWLKWPKG